MIQSFPVDDCDWKSTCLGMHLPLALTESQSTQPEPLSHNQRIWCHSIKTKIKTSSSTILWSLFLLVEHFNISKHKVQCQQCLKLKMMMNKLTRFVAQITKNRFSDLLKAPILSKPHEFHVKIRIWSSRHRLLRSFQSLKAIVKNCART